MIYCTCNRCQNRKLKKRRLVGIHRLNYGVYIEEPLPVHNIPEEPTDVTDDSHSQDEEQDMVMDEATSQINEVGVDEFIKDFYTSFEDVIDSPLAQLARTPVFSNADTSILATLMLLLNLKVTHGLTNTCFTDILRLLANKILPKDNKLPHSHREVSLVMKDIGMEYNTYDACPNDHILYYGRNANLQQCPVCHTGRYRQDQVSKKVPYKVL
ncbi:uncharacterized protein LOC131874628 [Cryptomeria japonica]|uniref:uncharacterized protein LOC131874628 n=1 Tax=Cryptomeria japonica TaxID=3369 RepID=UPI0027DA3DB1|nr:uncharacterized protein LOC131874628 [Cryptomeria japonica]